MQSRPNIGSIEESASIAAGATLIDSHCHLDFDSFATDVEEVIARAHRVGVDKMITIGASGPFEANREAIDIAARHASVFATVGVHPHEASSVTDAVLDEIERLAAHPCVVGIGETGLDYHYDNSPRPAQRAAFRRFARLAARLDLPLSIHLRDADADAAAILADEGTEAGGVIHCFSSDARAAETFVGLGLHISFSGILTFKTADALREAAAVVPADRILIETDSPFLAPVPHRGRRNEPALVVHTAVALAEARGESLATVARTTSDNAARLFRLSSTSS